MALYDRGYMRGSSPGEQALSGMGMIMVLIAINVVLFLAGNILPGLAEMLLLTPQGIRSCNSQPLGGYFPEMHRDLRGIHHQFVAHLAESDWKIRFVAQHKVPLPVCVHISGFQFQQLVSPDLQLINEVSG